MKQILRWSANLLATTFVFFALTDISQAAGKGKPKPKPIYTAIVSVDPTAMTITTESKNSNATATKTYKFTPKTTITVNGKTATAAGLTPGLQIRVGLGMDGGVAEELTAMNPPADPNAKK